MHNIKTRLCSQFFARLVCIIKGRSLPSDSAHICLRFVTTHHYWTNMRCDWSRKAYIQQTYSALFRGCSTPSCAEFARGRKRDEFFLFTFHFIYLPRM